MIWQSVGLQSVFRASEVFRLCCWCGISCDEMVSPISTVTHCGLEFCTKQPLVQTDIVCWMGALVCFMLSYFSLSAPLFLSLSLPISLIFYLSLFTLKLLNNLYCSVVEYALVAWINRDDVHAASRINNRRTCFHTKQEKNDDDNNREWKKPLASYCRRIILVGTQNVRASWLKVVIDLPPIAASVACILSPIIWIAAELKREPFHWIG